MPATREITLKQKRLADNYLLTGNKTQSALKAYNTTNYNTARMLGTREIAKDSVREYIRSKSEDAASRIYNLAMKSKNETVSLNASKDILDRAGYKPVDKHQSVKLNVNIKADSKTNKIKDKYEDELKKLLMQN